MRQPRYTYRRSTFFGNFPPGVKWLLIVNTVVFILTGLFGSQFRNDIRLLELAPVAVVQHFAIWQLVTYLFLHGGITHLLFNMLALWMFGTPLESDWGTRQFLKYYFICGIGAGICDVAINAAMGNWGTSTIGASGAIYGLLLAFGVCYPEQTVLMGFLFPIKAKYMVMIYAAIELYLSIGVNNGVSNIAHLGGMVVGFLYLKSHLPKLKLRLPDWRGAYRQWKLQRAKKKFQVYMRKHGDRGPFVN
ncbi:MAG: Rhomboid family protein [Candidatus Solibacter sp.]|jgi:membrane associated rhomboid family serine protease|nr:Rhomboid family protein [Candidatus Solibacter sp.]